VRIFDIGTKDDPGEVTNRILTIPNLLSFARLAVLPIIYLDLVNDRLLRAFVLLAIFAATDWLDGYIARRFDQVSRLGQLLDPFSDRVLFLVVGIGFVLADIVPWWVVLLVLARDVAVLVIGGILLLVRGSALPEVTRLGKTATFGLMWAFPTWLLAAVVGDGPLDPQPVLSALAWITYLVNIVLYYLAAIGYARSVLGRGSDGTRDAHDAAGTRDADRG
jgi:cardiolipin synthase (CMP-forming)